MSNERRALITVAAGLALAMLAPARSDAARRSLRYRLPADAIETLQFDVDQTVVTRFDRLPPEAEPYDVPALEQSLASVSTHLAGRIERLVGRVFRDSSLGLVTRVIDLDGSIDSGAGPHPVDWSMLEGKSVSMRVIDSGELLASSGWQHIAGAGRGGDVVQAVLLQSVLRLPFQVPEGEGSLPMAFRLRVPLDPLLNLDQAWDLSFEAADAPPGCGRRCVAVTYEGTATEAAVDGHPARPMKRDSRAVVSGTIVLDGKAGFLKEHRFRLAWVHSVSSLRENGTPRAEITQEQTITGVIREDSAR